MKEISLGLNGQVALVDDEYYDFLMLRKWNLSGGYAATEIQERGIIRRIYMHRLINKTPDGLHTDHINGDKLDNRKANLRTATRSDNQANRGSPNIKKTSRYKGVGWKKRERRWVAKITKDGKKYELGYFKNEDDAAIAYNNKAMELFGEFAYKNVTQ